MAKRLTDTDKWKKPFLRSMKAPYKLLWIYILDECDHAGIWQVDLDVAQLKIGEKLTIEKALEQLSGRVEVIDDGSKWFIPDFVDFQYGELNPANRVHNSVIAALRKHNLITENLKIKPLTSPLQGAKDKDKDLDKDKDKGVQGENGLIFHSAEIKIVWDKWIKYKAAEHKDKYKTAQSEQEGINKLVELSGGDFILADKIVSQSIADRYKGLFQLRQNNTPQTPQKITGDYTPPMVR